MPEIFRQIAWCVDEPPLLKGLHVGVNCKRGGGYSGLQLQLGVALCGNLTLFWHSGCFLLWVNMVTGMEAPLQPNMYTGQCSQEWFWGLNQYRFGLFFVLND